MISRGKNMTEHGGSAGRCGESSSLQGEALRAVLERCQRGEVDAFQALFDAYHRRVFNVAYALCADYATACDVSQEVFMKLLTRIRQFRFDSAFDTWLHRVVVNAAQDQRRGRRAEALESIEASLVAEPLQQADVESAEVERDVRQAMAALTPKLRQPIVLRYISGLSYDEISAVLGVSAGTVASRLARGHAALARSLQHLRPGARP